MQFHAERLNTKGGCLRRQRHHGNAKWLSGAATSRPRRSSLLCHPEAAAVVHHLPPSQAHSGRRRGFARKI